MASAATIHVSLITPERKVLETEATSVVFPQHDGLVGILKDRAPLVCELGIGVLRIETAGIGPQEFYIDGGFAQVRANVVTVLTPRAVKAADINTQAANQALQAKTTTEGQLKAQERARVQLRIAKRAGEEKPAISMSH